MVKIVVNCIFIIDLDSLIICSFHRQKLILTSKLQCLSLTDYQHYLWVCLFIHTHCVSLCVSLVQESGGGRGGKAVQPVTRSRRPDGLECGWMLPRTCGLENRPKRNTETRPKSALGWSLGTNAASLAQVNLSWQINAVWRPKPGHW